MSWPSWALDLCKQDNRPDILASPLQSNLSDLQSSSFSSYPASYAALLPDEPIPNPPVVLKRHVGLQLMHHCVGHQSVESILLGNKDNIWNDVAIQRDPESVCETCHITLSCKAHCNKHPDSFPTIPGRMVMVDIISNPFRVGLTTKSDFPFYMFIVDVYSSFPVLLGLHEISSRSVFRELQRYRTNFQASPNFNANP
jgi:hypothetical protein